MKTHVVLIDFENVQPQAVGPLSGGACQIKVFVGERQSKIPLATARALQGFGPHAEYVQIEGSGKNALDFHIAFYLGRLATRHPGAQFHVISKDTGFDPLIQHLKTLGIDCERTESIADVAKGPPTPSPSKPTRVDAVVANLEKRKSARPRTLKTLRTTVKALFGAQIADGEVEELIEQLIERGVVRVEGGKVHYTG